MPERVRPWVRAWFQGRNPDRAVDEVSNFYEKGYVDSFGIIEFIDAVESHFQIRFEDEDFRRDEFRTITTVSEMIADKLKRA